MEVEGYGVLNRRRAERRLVVVDFPTLLDKQLLDENELFDLED